MEYEEQQKDQIYGSEEEEKQTEDESIYNVEVRDQLLEDDELSPMEAAFMQGYDEAHG